MRIIRGKCAEQRWVHLLALVFLASFEFLKLGGSAPSHCLSEIIL